MCVHAWFHDTLTEKWPQRLCVSLEDPVPILSLEIMCPCVVLTTWNLTPPPPVSPQFPVGPVKDKLFWVKSDVLT